MKKKIIFLIIIIILLITIVTIMLINATNKQETYSLANDPEIQKIYEYGEYIESLDIPPNTIVAKINGDEVLFHEVESYRYSINYSIEQGTEESIGKNAFYEVLSNKLAVYMAKKYPEASNYNLNIRMNMNKTRDEWVNGYGEYTLEEARERWLSVLYIEKKEIWLEEEEWITYLQNISIEQMLTVKGNQIIADFMIEKPELVNDKLLEEKIEERNKIKEKQKELYDKGKEEKALELSSETTNLYSQIREIYTKDLILNSDLELCVDKGEFSYTVPTIYSE